MKPNRLQYVLARGFILSTRGSALGLVGFVSWQLLPALSLIPQLPFSFWLCFLLAIVITLPLGWILGGMLIWPWVAVAASKLNGAPFREGERVRVLIAPHRDRVLEVYAVWQDRHQVRAWLDEQHNNDVTDVFSYHEVCREPDIRIAS